MHFVPTRDPKMGVMNIGGKENAHKDIGIEDSKVGFNVIS